MRGELLTIYTPNEKYEQAENSSSINKLRIKTNTGDS